MVNRAPCNYLGEADRGHRKRGCRWWTGDQGQVLQRCIRQAESAVTQRAILLLHEAPGPASAPLMGDELVPSWAEAGRTAMRHALSMRGFWRRRPSTDDDGVAAALRVLAAAAPATRAGPSGQGHIRCRARRPLPLPLT